MLDSHALADLIAELVGDHVDRATAPLLERIRDLEGRETVDSVKDRLDAVERDLPSIAQRAAQAEERVAEIPIPQDGKDADPAVVRAMVEELVAAIPAPKDGERGADGRDGVGIEAIDLTQDGPNLELSITIGGETTKFLMELPEGPAGQDGKDGEAGRDGVDGQQGERGVEGPAGKLPVVREWEEAVHYEGAVVTFRGATYQAVKDTGREPTTDDWTCLAAKGENGRDARELTFLGTFSPEATYETLSVVAMNGASFVAKRDDPGPCPGDGWQLMAAQGKRGAPGERGVGAKGDRGDPGQPLAAAGIDEDGLMTLVNGDGSVVTCDLYPVLTKVGQ